MEKFRYAIIGCGPTGIGAAYRLKELGIHDFIILEKSSFYGGLATSFIDEQGFTWDIGGHVQFSHYPYFDKAMDIALGTDGWLDHQRESWVWMHNRFIPYPFQNNIHRLPTEIRDECLKELKNNPQREIKNFHDWILNQFGTGIARHFLFPYNFKVWAYEPHQMNSSWVGERVSTIDIKRIEENIKLNRDDVSWGPNNMFRFPKSGGTGAIWKSLSKKIGFDKIRLNTAVKSIHAHEKTINTDNGNQIQYEHILSTMPLDNLTKKIIGLDQKIVKEAADFKYSSTHIIGIGIKGKPHHELSTKCWMYFPEDNCPFYRVTLFSNYSPMNVPDKGGPYFSLMVEVSESHFKKVRRDALVEEVIQGLINTKLISAQDQIVSKWQYFAEHGYPTPFLDRDTRLKKIIPTLDDLQIFSRGRFGGWKYEVSNQDHSFMQGVEWVNRMENNEKELTFQA
ncbi:MAG: amine oxidase [Bdellovibrio sp. CG12_big_fil_rev_8_21_14_0_65_39_13]|nr:MAG: amine oxidase [Bdellovibrio sp. CG22_combo_CG10-13_8_21_14_all_39_27]PIQ58701.1 MAG: amine oxidase [Bdellovibrio sp. CG12_big_fil_rev_8_21_14_0_65_39_13]PIR33076.1 MAG: amine oxidase [Bdellovibrio sp. CG11_big_fil_rev_8_21_14_0_20_39_38]PJB53291.1 MAG: amine oxidase [Bdellovibrio sp. CG_4_9_14_3_um_filter_39_7]